MAFGFRTADAARFLPQAYCIMLVACGPLARRINRQRLAGACETVGLLYAQGFALVALLYPMTAIAAPFADAKLAAADRLLGFDWPAFATSLRDHPLVLQVMKVAYFSFSWQGVLLLCARFWAREARRAWTVIFAANFALVLTLLIYPLLPAAGTFFYYGIRPQDYPNMASQLAWSFAPAIEAIRDHHARFITRELMVPFVSFPSYHATAALLFAWAAWPLKKLRWPMMALNLVMASSALIYGGHYLVDLLGGTLVAVIGTLPAARVLKPFHLEPQ